jgi:hypothetical protein
MNPPPLSGELARPSTFWIGLAGVFTVAACTYRESTISDFVGFLLITAAALLPAALWCWRRTHGLPIFPLFAAGTIGTFALPLIAHHPLVVEYSPRDRFMAALAVAGTNLAGTVAWYAVSRARPAKLGGSCLILRPGFGSLFFTAVLLGTIAFDLAQLTLETDLDPSVFSLLRAGIIALSNLAIFVLSYLWGGRGLSRLDRVIYAALVVATMISTLPSALMVGALAYGLMALIGYALGRGRVPWLSLTALCAAALFLQGGKEDLRNKYWYSADAAPISLVDFPGLLVDWVCFSVARLDNDRSTPDPVPSDSQSLVERASLLQLFLRIQQMSPAQVPYLHGRTYTIIPGLLVPRVFNKEKARTHEGTYMLAIHYDLQTTEDTLTTTIGFGLINEAMANFGYAGCLALGAGLGLFYGAVARWSAGYPLLSLRSFFAILVLSVAFENEFSAGVYVTTLFQGGCVLLVFALLAMLRVPALPARRPPALAGASA